MSTIRSHKLLRLLLRRQPGDVLAAGRGSSSLAGADACRQPVPNDGRTLSDFLPPAPGHRPAHGGPAHAESMWADGPAPRYHIVRAWPPGGTKISPCMGFDAGLHGSAHPSQRPPLRLCPANTPPPPHTHSRACQATYGCQMNVNDSEVVAAILAEHGMAPAPSAQGADVVLLNTCAIRENAEARIWGRLAQLRDAKRRRREEAADK